MTTFGVSGHQNIPEEAIEFIEKGIMDAFKHVGSRITGVSSLAVGADQLFARAVLQAGGSLHVVIPCHNIETTFLDSASLHSFQELLERANSIETLAFENPSGDAYLAAGRLTVEISDVVIAIWDGFEAKGKGGTGDIVKYAREQGRELIIIWPPGITR